MTDQSAPSLTASLRADLALMEHIPLHELDESHTFTLDQHLAFNRVTERIPDLLDRLESLEAQRNEAIEAHHRVVANEGNHYDRYWAPPPEPLTEEWLTATEAKMREALTDVFCDDAAAVMLTLIAEIRRVTGSSSSLTPGAGDATQVAKDGLPGSPSDRQPVLARLAAVEAERDEALARVKKAERDESEAWVEWHDMADAKAEAYQLVGQYRAALERAQDELATSAAAFGRARLVLSEALAERIAEKDE